MNCWYLNVCSHEICDGCIRYAEMKYLLDNSDIPARCQKPIELIAGNDYDAFCKLADIKDSIIDFVDTGLNLYICSDETGNGKTSWAIKLLLKYFDKVWAGNGFRVRGKFVHVPTLLTVLKDFSVSHEDLKAQLESADLVVWDDIASIGLSNYDLSQLLVLLDVRMLNGKSNIYTGNITVKDKIDKALGNRLSSRVWNSSQIVEFKGRDRRYGTVADNQ